MYEYHPNDSLINFGSYFFLKAKSCVCISYLSYYVFLKCPYLRRITSKRLLFAVSFKKHFLLTLFDLSFKCLYLFINMDEQVELMKKYPLLIANDTCTEYDGFMDINGIFFRVRLEVPNYPSLKELKLEGSWNFWHVLNGQVDLLKKWAMKGSITSFLENLKQFLVENDKTNFNDNEERITASSFKLLADDLQNIGFQNVLSISSCLTQVTLRTIDSSNRIHSIVIKVGKHYPSQPMEIQAELPECVLQTIKKHTVLQDIYKSFVSHVTSLQHLWNVLDIVDTFCCVLEPENPTRKDIGRRIVIENNISVYLNMNLEDLQGIPSVTFLGPGQLVETYQAKIAANCELWDPCNNFLDNLKLLLGVDSFPSKEQASEEALVQQGDCCICFTMRLDGKVPSEVCDNAQCGSIFHGACLFEWLQSVVNSYQSFQRVYGACPNCGMAISCPIPC